MAYWFAPVTEVAAAASQRLAVVAASQRLAPAAASCVGARRPRPGSALGGRVLAGLEAVSWRRRRPRPGGRGGGHVLVAALAEAAS